jgi:hypothetical protein
MNASRRQRQKEKNLYRNDTETKIVTYSQFAASDLNYCHLN